MPGSWPDGDAVGDDDPADDEPVGDLRPPVHPDDRLWRHPSEVAWDRTTEELPAVAAEVRPPRVWALALASAMTGAVLALGTVALVGGLGTERAVDDPSGQPSLLRQTELSSPSALATVAESVLPSVVRIEVDGEDGPRSATGLVVADDGHVLTNAHVVAGARLVTLVVADGTAVPAEVVGVDRVTDIAVVAPVDGHTDDAAWSPAALGSADGLRIGQPVVAVGAATDAGAMPSVAVGVVAAVGTRVVTVEGEPLHGMIATDAPVAATATGGALCDDAGSVVGLATTRSDGSGAGYATPIDVAWAAAEELMRNGVVRHVWLGIEGSDRPATATSAIGLEGAGGGVLVERVVPGSPAEAAGLRSRDVLLELDGETIGTMSDLVVLLRRHRPDDQVDLSVLRDGEVVEVSVTLVER